MYAPPDDDIRRRVAGIEAVCAEFRVPLRAAALQFADLNPMVSSVVAGLRSAAEVRAAVDAFNLPIPQEFWERLKSNGLIDPAAPTEPGEADAGMSRMGARIA